MCGSAFCKGKYLQLSNDKKSLGIMKNEHTFLDRNFIIYKAVTQRILSDIDKERLRRNGLGDSSLAVAPEWLKVWASLVCEYLEYEEERYTEFFKEDYPKNYDVDMIKIDAKAQKESQIQNIAITIDKIMHVLESMETVEPPIRALTYEERYSKIWVTEGCLKETII